MPRMIHHDRMVKLFQKALFAGATRRSISHLAWDISGNCHSPYVTELTGRPEAEQGQRYVAILAGKKMSLHLDISTRCRKCPACAAARSNLWRYRVKSELQASARSWFGTLTMSPDAHYRVMCAASHKRATGGTRWADLTETERFADVASASLKEVTRYIKRLRKQSKVPLRYIVVTEKHKSGLPHFHMLVHEVELKPITHKILSTQWKMGFEKWRLVPIESTHHARYVTKYISKDALTRIRASQHYGQTESVVGGLMSSIRSTP